MKQSRRLYERHAEICHVFTSPMRLMILDLLREGEKTVSELAERTHLRQPNVSQHLAVMRRAGVLAVRRDGTHLHYSVRSRKILKAFDIIKELLREQMEEAGEMAMAPSRRRE